MTKEARGPHMRSGLHMWAKACVCRLTQLGFQKHEKGKFFAIMTGVWNESHII